MSDKDASGSQISLFADNIESESAIREALNIQHKAAQNGFDWPEIFPVFDKIIEELEELREEVYKVKERLEEGDASGLSFASSSEVRAEYGDLLFSCLNLSRFLDISPDDALRVTNNKFISRFQFIEKQLQEQGKLMSEESLTSLDQLWELAKQYEKGNRA